MNFFESRLNYYTSKIELYKILISLIPKILEYPIKYVSNLINE